MLDMPLGSSRAVVGIMQVGLPLTMIGLAILACLRCVTRAFVRGRRDNVNGSGTLGNSVCSVAADILRVGIANMKLAVVSGDRIALGELECERPIVHCSSWCAVEICEAGSCDRLRCLPARAARRMRPA